MKNVIHVKRSAIAFSAVIAALGIMPSTGTAGSGHDAASAGPKATSSAAARVARRNFAVLRRHKARRDIIRSRSRSTRTRAKLAALDSRLVFDGGAEYKLYLILQSPRVCLSMVNEARGSSGGTCTNVGDLVAGRQMLALGELKPTAVHFAVAAPDGSRDAQRTGPGGAVSALPIANNVIVDTLTELSTISFTDRLGQRRQLPPFGPWEPRR